MVCYTAVKGRGEEGWKELGTIWVLGRKQGAEEQSNIKRYRK